MAELAAGYRMIQGSYEGQSHVLLLERKFKQPPHREHSKRIREDNSGEGLELPG